MKLKFIIITTLIALFFAACRPEPLEIVVPPLESKVVVFSQIIPDAFMIVSLTRSFGALDFNEEEGDTLTNDFVDQLLVSDAQVTVHYRDLVDTLFEVEKGTGIYISLGTPSFVNEEYTLRVLTKEGEEISAKSIMLPQVQFETITPIIERTEEDTIVKVAYSFVDPPEDNFYMLHFYTNGEPKEDGIDVNSFFNSGSNLLKKSRLLSDVVFENNFHQDTIELSNVSHKDSLLVTLSNINEDYYRFLDLRDNSSNFFAELTKEPVNYPTNVEGGLGFFNTHFPDVQVFDLNEY